MKQVLEVYGRFLVDAVVLVILLLLLFLGIKDADGNQGVFHIVGAKLNTMEKEDSTFFDFLAYQEQSSYTAPVITYKGEAAMETGSYQIGDCVQAFDAQGDELSVKLLGIFLPGEEEMRPVFSQTETLLFEEPGIYTLKVQAIDSRRKKTVDLISIPVNRRR